MDHPAAPAAVDQDPLTGAAHRDGDRFHGGAAFGGPVAGPIIDVSAPQTRRTVVSVGGARRFVRYVQPTVPAAKAAGTMAATTTIALIASQVLSLQGWRRPC
jgi:hypothetical protein